MSIIIVMSCTCNMHAIIVSTSLHVYATYSDNAEWFSRHVIRSVADEGQYCHIDLKPKNDDKI